jgi:hypothetical protein
MAQIGDRITYVGDGNDGTTEGAAYSGVLTRLNGPGGWGSSDINIDLDGTPTDLFGVQRDDLLTVIIDRSGVQPNGTWRIVT